MKCRFKLDINLDDPNEVADFIGKHGMTGGRRLASRLGFKGRGAYKAASALSNYAWNKGAAIRQRLAGNCGHALVYERICDRIYVHDILGKIECW